MNTQELIAEIQKLPLEEQKKLLEVLSRRISQKPESHQPISEDELDRLLLEKGIIGSIPDAANYTDEDEDFDPIEVAGKPLSETIIEERR
jgi:hypothetical protein